MNRWLGVREGCGGLRGRGAVGSWAGSGVGLEQLFKPGPKGGTEVFGSAEGESVEGARPARLDVGAAGVAGGIGKKNAKDVT